jgi:hypothetical protein
MRHCNPKPNEILTKVAEFLAAGGRITPVAPGESGLDPKFHTTLTVAQKAKLEKVR